MSVEFFITYPKNCDRVKSSIHCSAHHCKTDGMALLFKFLRVHIACRR